MSDTYLQPGDVLRLEGPEPSHIVDYVNESRARAVPLRGGRVHTVTPLVGEPKTIEDQPNAVNICTVLDRSLIVERVGQDGIKNYLLAAAARRKEQRSAAQTETRNDNDMEKTKRKARGGLAATLATLNGETDKPKRGRKPKAAKTDAPRKKRAEAKEGDGNRGALGQIMGHSVVKVIRALSKDGATPAHVAAICAAQGVKPKLSTIKINRSAVLRGAAEAAPLTKEQLRELRASAPEPETEAAKN